MVERRSSSWGSFVQLATLGPNASSYADSRARVGVRHEYRVYATNAAGSSAPSNVAGTTLSPLGPDVVFPDPASPLPATPLMGAVELAYVAYQPQGLRVDVVVEFAPLGSGAFRRATQAGADPGGPTHGVSAVEASATGVAHRFLWDTTADFPHARADGVQVRIALITPFGDQSPWRLVGGLTVDNRARFAPSISVALPQQARCLTFADLDRDGRLDLLATLPASGEVAVLLGRGGGAFDSPRTFAVGTSPSGLAVADLNRDGRPDVAVANAGSDNVTVLLGDGLGGLAAGTHWNAGDEPVALAIADLDRDGKPDLVLANHGSNDVSVLRGAGGGTFLAASSTAVGSGPAALVVADLNRDGVLDLALANDASNDITVLPGTGAGGFGGATTLTAGPQPGALATGDLDLDGDPDLVVANGGTQSIAVFPGDGAGGFGPAVTIATGSSPRALAIADLDQNGWLDVVIGEVGSNQVRILPGEGAGVLGAPTTWPLGSAPDCLVTADFDADGRLDVAAVGGANGVSVLRNTSPLAIRRGFEAPLYRSVGSATLASGDLDRDGRQDLVVANAEGGVSLYLGRGDGTLAAVTSLSAGPAPQAVILEDWNEDGWLDLGLGRERSLHIFLSTGPSSFASPIAIASVRLLRLTHLASADLNGDGRPDLIAGTEAGRVCVLLNTGGGTFGPVQVQDVGSEPKIVAVGDVSGDGMPDVVASDRPLNRVWVALGAGDGTFASPVSYLVGGRPSCVVIAELNGDGSPDLAVSNSTGNTLSILTGVGNGTFLPAVTLAAGTGPTWVISGDFDANGRNDVAVSYSGRQVSVFLGTPTGLGTRVDCDAAPADVLLSCELDGDGRSDLALAMSGRYLAVMRGLGTGSFRVPARFPGGPGPSYGLVVGDLNRDGDLDVVVTNQPTNEVSVALGNGAGALGPLSTYPVGAAPQGASLADVTRDGILDLVVANNFAFTVAVLPGDGAGGFLGASHHAVTGSPYHLAVVDLNGDGWEDIAAACFGGTVEVLLGTGPGTFAPPTAYPTTPGSSQVAVADFDRDGVLDLALGSEAGGSTQVSVLLGLGDGTFGTTTLIDVGMATRSVQAVDLEGDGDPDLVGCGPFGVNPQGASVVLLSDGAGGFSPPVLRPAGTQSGTSAVSDLDGDGLPEFTWGGNLEITSLMYGGDARARVSSFCAIVSPFSLAAGDLDHDGRIDVVTVGSGFGPTIAVLRQGR